MNIVYCVAQCNNISGGIRIIFEQANLLQDRGHEVQIWSIAPVDTIAHFDVRVPVLHMPADYDHQSQRVIRLYPERIKAKIPDIYIAGSFPTAYGCLSLPDTKCFWYLQHDESVQFAELFDPGPVVASYEEALKLPIKLISNSHWTKKRLKEKYHVDSTVLPCGIDLELFTPASPILNYDHSPTVLAAYNESSWKGPEDLLSALEIVMQSYPELNVIFYSASTRPQLSANFPITYFYNPPQTKLKNIYSSATVFVSSSREEGFGLPGLEALACGIPLVTTDSGGINEYAIHRENAVIVPPKDGGALAQAIFEVIGDKSLQAELQKNGIARAREFEWTKIIDDLVTILDI